MGQDTEPRAGVREGSRGRPIGVRVNDITYDRLQQLKIRHKTDDAKVIEIAIELLYDLDESRQGSSRS